jgi:hypothetical protein
VFLRRVAIANDPLQPLAVVVDQLDANLLSHAPRFAYANASVNPMSGSVH